MAFAGMASVLLLVGLIGYYVYWRQYQRIYMEPDAVAENFLEAIVDGDKATARLYAKPSCDLVVEAMSSMMAGKSADVVIERTEHKGLYAWVHYHYEGNPSSALKVDWDSKGWRVDCTEF